MGVQLSRSNSVPLSRIPDYAKHTHSIYGRALLQGISLAPKAKAPSHHHQSELFLAVELLRLGVLHGNAFRKTYASANSTVAGG